MTAISSLDVDGATVSWTRDGTIRGRPCLVLAHGAGAPMTSPFMAFVAERLARRGLCVLRFNFPYMERASREGRRRPPDAKPRLLDTWEAMLGVARRLRGHGPIVIGGKSMGGRIASMLAADGRAEDVRGLVYFGYPLHPPSKPEKLRADHLTSIEVPQLFLSGTRDALAEPRLLRRVVKGLPRATLVALEGADHSLARSRRDPFAGADVWLDAAAAFAIEVARGDGR
ncbi:MAG: alpha/beta fold hydrolase [Sandaracinaceae bacterium]